MNLLQLRAKDAKDKAAFYSGATNVHPHGISGRRFITAPEDTKRCWDTSPDAWRFSEWDNFEP